MDYSSVKRLLVGISLLLYSLTGGCGGRQAGGGISVDYTPPFVPIKVSYDFVDRKLQVSMSGRIQTPIGGLGATASAESAPEEFAGVRTLTLESGADKYVYQLEKGKSYSISLPSDVNGEAKVIYSGADDNLSIVIPQPTSENVGELLRRFDKEQEADQQAEAEARSKAKRAEVEARRRAKTRAAEALEKPASRPKGS